MHFPNSMDWALMDEKSVGVDRVIFNILEICEVQLAL